MTHKEKCAALTMELLQSRNMKEYYSQSILNYYYNKSMKRAADNAYAIALNAADLMINQPVKTTQP